MNSDDKNQKMTKKGQEKLNEILDGALKFFIEPDSTGFTTTELADHLNMTQANLYHYVQSKRELWFAITLKIQYEIRDGLLEICGQQISHFDKLLLMVKMFLNYVKSHPERIYLQYRTNPPQSKEKGPFELEEMKKFNNDNLEILGKVLKEGVDSGEFHSNMDPDEKVFFYWSLVYGATNYFLIGELYQSITDKGSIDYETLKRVEAYERTVVQVVEEDLKKYLSSRE